MSKAPSQIERMDCSSGGNRSISGSQHGARQVDVLPTTIRSRFGDAPSDPRNSRDGLMCSGSERPSSKLRRPSRFSDAPKDPCNSRDGLMRSSSEQPSSKNHFSQKRSGMKSPTSPKKRKMQTEPGSLTKQAEEDAACGKVSSKVLYDSMVVTTATAPPMDSNFVKAPESSLSTSLLPWPAISPQVVYHSHFEKFDPKDDIFSRDQDSYLKEARKLKESGEREGTITAQAAKYLEAGLCFILTGILMERDYDLGFRQTFTSNAPLTMYKDTLSYIKFISGRWRSRQENLNALEAKIVVLCMRCQALLSMKLFNMKIKETKNMGKYLQDYFLMEPPPPLYPLPAPINPQLSTPVPKTSPTGSSGTSVLHHSPRHPDKQVPQRLYKKINQHCSNTLHVVMAHYTWDKADSMIASKYHMEEFFIGIDRQFGPLTLHSSLADLVRYVRHGIQLMKAS